MKALTIFSIALVIFAAAPVLACGGGGDKDKEDTAAFTIDVQTLCGGDKGDKPADDAAYLCDKPKSDQEPQFLCGDTCGGDKGDKPADDAAYFCDKPKSDQEPQLLCGGTCGGEGKDETKA